jgi:hypothetical protein
MAAPEPLVAYAIGVAGSLATEVAAAVKMSTEHGGICPPLYKKPFFILARIGFALIGAGLLPIMMDAASLWSAFYLGISAPLVFDRLARGLQSDKPSGGNVALPVPGEVH